MGKSANIYQSLRENCRSSPDGMVDFTHQAIQEVVIDLFQFLYRQASYYFHNRHADDIAQDLATQAAQNTWEHLLTCQVLAGVREEDAFLGFARRSVIYECWRMQRKFEQEKIIDGGEEGETDEEEGEDWLELLMDRYASVSDSLLQDPQSLLHQFTECLVYALIRLKNVEQRMVIVLEYLANLDEQKLAFILSKPLGEIRNILNQARAHGLQVSTLAETLQIDPMELQAYIDKLAAAGIKAEKIAHICGIALERVRSLQSRTKKRGVSPSDDKLLMEVLRWTPAVLAKHIASLSTHPIKNKEVALAFECARAEIEAIAGSERGELAEDYEIALILGTTRSNVQAMHSRARQSLREDRAFLECLNPV